MLVTCPECGVKISSEASPCPKCGLLKAGKKSKEYQEYWKRQFNKEVKEEIQILEEKLARCEIRIRQIFQQKKKIIKSFLLDFSLEYCSNCHRSYKMKYFKGNVINFWAVCLIFKCSKCGKTIDILKGLTSLAQIEKIDNITRWRKGK
jgi:hypothetical protein